MSNKLYKEDTKKKKKKETEIGTFMGRIIYGCTLSLIAILLLIASLYHPILMSPEHSLDL